MVPKMESLEPLRKKVKSGWNKRIELMNDKLEASRKTLENLEKMNFQKKGLKERLISRQVNRIDKLLKLIDEIEGKLKSI